MKKRAFQSLILGVSIGAAVGLGAYTFIYAKGGSYLTNKSGERMEGLNG